MRITLKKMTYKTWLLEPWHT